MDKKTFQLDIVSAEKTLYSGEAVYLSVMGIMGELGISAGHAPLLTALKPGAMQLHGFDEPPEWFYVSGGILEVQPQIVTVLADVAERAHDIDEAAAVAAQEKARQAMADREADKAYSTVAVELAQAAARLRAIQELKRNLRR